MVTVGTVPVSGTEKLGGVPPELICAVAGTAIQQRASQIPQQEISFIAFIAFPFEVMLSYRPMNIGLPSDQFTQGFMAPV
jgi:hypothetical protein